MGLADRGPAGFDRNPHQRTVGPRDRPVDVDERRQCDIDPGNVGRPNAHGCACVHQRHVSGDVARVATAGVRSVGHAAPLVERNLVAARSNHERVMAGSVGGDTGDVGRLRLRHNIDVLQRPICSHDGAADGVGRARRSGPGPWHKRRGQEGRDGDNRQQKSWHRRAWPPRRRRFELRLERKVPPQRSHRRSSSWDAPGNVTFPRSRVARMPRGFKGKQVPNGLGLLRQQMPGRLSAWRERRARSAAGAPAPTLHAPHCQLTSCRPS